MTGGELIDWIKKGYFKDICSLERSSILNHIRRINDNTAFTVHPNLFHGIPRSIATTVEVSVDSVGYSGQTHYQIRSIFDRSLKSTSTELINDRIELTHE